jgi:putative transposase
MRKKKDPSIPKIEYDNKTFKYRIKDSVVSKHLNKMSGSVNFLWNYCNDLSEKEWKKSRKFISEYDLLGLTKGSSKELNLNSQTIQMVVEEFCKKRYQFKKIKLNWRSFLKKKTLGWIPFSYQSIKLEKDTAKYLKLKIKYWKSRGLEGQFVSGCFVQDSESKWYICLVCRTPKVEFSKLGKIVGIDLGLREQIVCSDETKYIRENLTKEYAEKLAKVQRAKRKKQVTKIYAKIKNVRKDFAHKTSKKIADKFAIIKVGNVSSSKLIKTKFAKSVLDAGWGQFKTLLEYKVRRQGGVFLKVNEMWSTVTCSGCFKRTGPSGLSALGVRDWICENCNAVHDRNVNSAIIIEKIPVPGMELQKGIPSL